MKTRIVGSLIIGLDLKSANLRIETDDGIECSKTLVENTEKLDVQDKDQVIEIEFVSKVGKITCCITLDILKKILVAAEQKRTST